MRLRDLLWSLGYKVVETDECIITNYLVQDKNTGKFIDNGENDVIFTTVEQIVSRFSSELASLDIDLTTIKEV